jgi:hypothetical protein
MVATTGSATDAILKQIPPSPGIGGPLPMNTPSAPPEPPMSLGGAMAPAPKPAAPTTSTPGWGGIMDIYRQAGGLTSDQYQSEADKILKQVNQANQGAITGIEQNMQRRDALMGQPIPHPGPPQLHGMPQAPDTRIKNPLQVFQSGASILGLLGSMFTRRPLVTAMNAASAAIKGYAEGDKDAAERAHKSWKDSLEQAVAQNQAEMDQYNVLLQDSKLSMDERAAQLQAIAAQNNDQNMLAALRSGEPQMAFEILDGRQKAAQSLSGMLIQAQQFEQSQALERARLDEQRRYHDSLGGASLGMDDDTINMLAQQYLSGDRTALQGLGQGRAGAAIRAQVLQRANQLAQSQGNANPDIALNRATYAADAKTLSQMQNYISRADTFQSVFLKNVQQVKKYSEAGVAGSIPALNKWIQAGRKATGDPDVAAFDAAIKTASREYARIMSGPTSNAQLTVSAQANADEMLSNVMNKEQLEAVITVMEQDINNSIQSADETMKSIRSSISANGGKQESPGAGAPPAEAVSELKADPSPENRKYFDDVFGPGAAKEALSE